MKRYISYIWVLGAIALAGCQKESAFHIEDNRDAVVRIAPSIAKVSDNLTKSAVATEEQEGIALLSDNGGFTLPMTCETSEGIILGGVSSQISDGVATKGTLHNETGSDVSLGKYVDNFMVAAWNIPSSGDPVKVIPDGSASAFGSGYVSDGYQKVMKRTASDDSEYWMTVQPQTVDDFKTTLPNADDEYIWESGETKTFYAYANLPESGATMALLSKGAGQTMTYTVPAVASAQTDIMMGFYNGTGGGTGTAGIEFKHPFTAVRFMQGKMEDVEGIRSITISGLAKSGSVTMDADGVISNWTITGDDYSATATLSDGENLLEVDETTKLIGMDSEGNYNGAFLLIPQDLSAHKVTVTAVLITGGGDITVSGDITSGTWQAGKTNTYTLGYMKVTPEAVDLGLSVLWATFNVGASAPEDFGDYFAWAATEPWYEPGYALNPVGHWKPGKEGGYNWNNTPYQQTVNPLSYDATTWSKYTTDGEILELMDDAANANWGNPWRMPTQAEFEELIDNTEKEYIYIDSKHYGYIFTSTKVGYKDKSIFIPSAGCYSGTTRSSGSSKFLYWSSLVNINKYQAQKFFYQSNIFQTGVEYRYLGCPVRPVKPKAPTE